MPIDNIDKFCEKLNLLDLGTQSDIRNIIQVVESHYQWHLEYNQDPNFREKINRIFIYKILLDALRYTLTKTENE